MERDTRETVDADYKYLISDGLLDSMLAGEMTAPEALAQYQLEIADAQSQPAAE